MKKKYNSHSRAGRLMQVHFFATDEHSSAKPQPNK